MGTTGDGGALLLADVGGTNSRLALATEAGILRATLRRRANDSAAGPEDLIGGYLAEMAAQGAPAPGAAVIALAGPVTDPARARLTNRPWSFDAQALAAHFGLGRVLLVNDLTAAAAGVPEVPAEGITPLRGGRPAPPLVLVNLGTGFNAAALIRTPSGATVPAPAEAGWAFLPHLADAEADALSEALAPPGRPAVVEELFSGVGLRRLAAHLDLPAEPAELAAQIVSGRGRAGALRPAIARLFGAVCGDLAMVHLATGGVVLKGSVAAALAPLVAREEFAAAFAARGPYAGLAGAIPVALSADPWLELRGCAVLAGRPGALV
ncbi:MAG: hypothetical protein D6832_01485 [Alphaproteobacteria bacterium]|nr:MAG: hypothetical protein D6832_01485 [Alphaproteobacteria bacterium]